MSGAHMASEEGNQAKQQSQTPNDSEQPFQSTRAHSKDILRIVDEFSVSSPDAVHFSASPELLASIVEAACGRGNDAAAQHFGSLLAEELLTCEPSQRIGVHSLINDLPLAPRHLVLRCLHPHRLLLSPGEQAGENDEEALLPFLVARQRVLNWSAFPMTAPHLATFSLLAPQLNPLLSLNLNGCSLGSSGVHHLTSALPSLPALSTLSLNHNSIDSASGATIAGALHHCPSLATLSLRSNALTAAGAEPLVVAAARLQALTLLDLASNAIAFPPPFSYPLFGCNTLQLRIAPPRGPRPRRDPSPALLQATFLDRHVRQNVEVYSVLCILLRIVPVALGLHGVSPWFVAACLAAVAVYVQTDMHAWFHAQRDAVQPLLPLTIVAAAASAASLAIASATLQDPTWDDGSHEGHAARLRFAVANATTAAISVYCIVTLLCLYVSFRAAQRARPGGGVVPRLAAAAHAARILYPYVELPLLVGLLPAAVTWLSVADAFTLLSDELGRLMSAHRDLIGLSVNPVALLPFPRWVFAISWMCTMAQLQVLVVPLLCSVLRVTLDFLLRAACAMARRCVRLVWPPPTPTDNPPPPGRLVVNLRNNLVSDMAALRLLALLGASASPSRTLRIVLTSNRLSLHSALSAYANARVALDWDGEQLRLYTDVAGKQALVVVPAREEIEDVGEVEGDAPGLMLQLVVDMLRDNRLAKHLFSVRP